MCAYFLIEFFIFLIVFHSLHFEFVLHIVFLLQLPVFAYTFSCLSLLFHWFCGGCFWDWCACFYIFHLRIPRPQDQTGARTLFLWEWPLFFSASFHFGILLDTLTVFANFFLFLNLFTVFVCLLFLIPNGWIFKWCIIQAEFSFQSFTPWWITWSSKNH